MLKIEQVVKKFGEHTVLQNISLEIGQENIVGLAGNSGGGKSTLLRCIQGLETLDSGSISYAGRCGFMFQDFQLFPHMTVLQNLIYAPSLDKSNPADHQALALELLRTLGVENKATVYPHHLSGGQKQRVALARSLMMKPDLLLCDEPTSGLDVATIQEVIHLLESVNKLGVSMIIASHDLDFLTQLADRIIVIQSGKIIVDVLPETLEEPIDYLKKYYE